MFNCDNSFRDFISHCGATITAFVALTANTEYDVTITDKFDNKYQATYTSDENGNVDLDIADFPEGLFNVYAGDLLLEFFEDDKRTSLEIIDTRGNTKTYDGILFNVIGGNSAKSYLGCSNVGVYG